MTARSVLQHCRGFCLIQERWSQQLSHLWWHPHQRLWNWDLIARIGSCRWKALGNLLSRAVVFIDSCLLALANPPWSLWQTPSEARVLWVDLGLHEDGKQVRFVSELFRHKVAELKIVGFEANPQTYEAARRALTDIPNLELVCAAAVGPSTDTAAVNLFLVPGGKGDSIRPERNQSGFVSVDAIRISDFLSRRMPEYARFHAVFLRMNIEGAEYEVLKDLIHSDQIRIDGYYGMWDDLSKIDKAADQVFRDFLQLHSIRNLTFNDRDFENPHFPSNGRTSFPARIRLFVIRKHISKAIRIAWQRNSKLSTSRVS